MAFFYFLGFAMFIVIYMTLTVIFTHYAAKERGDFVGSGHSGMGSLRYASRMLAIAWSPKSTYVRILRLILRFFSVVSFLGFCGAIYVTFVDGSRPGECDACQLDPAGRTLIFWLGYALVVLIVLSMSLGSLLVARADRRPKVSMEMFDSRRFNMGMKLIFGEVGPQQDRSVNQLRYALRWMILFALIDALALIALSLI